MPERLKKGATIRDVAREAGVSTATVSYVTNGRAVVGPATRQRVLEAIRQLDYQPSGLARGLAGQALRVIGLLAPDPDDRGSQFRFAEALRGISEALWGSGYSLLLSPPQSPPASSDLRAFGDKGAEGVIVLGEKESFSLLKSPSGDLPSFPVVCLGRAPGGLPWLDTDHRLGIRLAVQHLYGLGHTQIAFLAGPATSPVARERLAGFVAAVEEAGLPVEPDFLVHAEATVAGGFQAMHRLLSLGHRPTAVVCHSDAMALGALDHARSKGVEIPDQLALVGFGDEPFAAYVQPSLTTIREPLAELGRRAAGRLLALLAGAGGGVDSGGAGKSLGETLAPKLVVRESCGSQFWL